MSKSCYDCIFMATHERCQESGGCLNTPEDFAQYRETGKMPDYRYRHHVPAGPVEQMDRLHALEVMGYRNIVVGGVGEAEVNTRWSPEKTAGALHAVSAACGYMCGRLERGPDGKRHIFISTHDGTFRIEWVDGRLTAIRREVWRSTDGVSVLVKSVPVWTWEPTA